MCWRFSHLRATPRLAGNVHYAVKAWVEHLRLSPSRTSGWFVLLHGKCRSEHHSSRRLLLRSSQAVHKPKTGVALPAVDSLLSPYGRGRWRTVDKSEPSPCQVLGDGRVVGVNAHTPFLSKNIRTDCIVSSARSHSEFYALLCAVCRRECRRPLRRALSFESLHPFAAPILLHPCISVKQVAHKWYAIFSTYRTWNGR